MKERKRFLKSLELVLFRTEYSTRLLFYVNYFTSTQDHKLELQLNEKFLDLFSREREREREREFASVYLYFATMYLDLVSVFYLKILFLLQNIIEVSLTSETYVHQSQRTCNFS